MIFFNTKEERNDIGITFGDGTLLEFNTQSSQGYKINIDDYSKYINGKHGPRYKFMKGNTELFSVIMKPNDDDMLIKVGKTTSKSASILKSDNKKIFNKYKDFMINNKDLMIEYETTKDLDPNRREFIEDKIKSSFKEVR